MLFENHLILSVDVASSMQNHCKKFKIKIFIKEKEKIKRIMMTTTKNCHDFSMCYLKDVEKRDVRSLR